jgi:hypothetical protein
MLCALFETSLANLKSNAHERIHMAQPPGTSILCFMVHPCCGLVAIKVMKELIYITLREEEGEESNRQWFSCGKVISVVIMECYAF